MVDNCAHGSHKSKEKRFRVELDHVSVGLCLNILQNYPFYDRFLSLFFHFSRFIMYHIGTTCWIRLKPL